MAKLIKKSKCKFENGYIVKKNNQIGIPLTVWLQLNKLETMYQQYTYLLSQPAYQAGPSLEGFKKVSALESKLPYVEAPETPVSDKLIAESLAFMEEADKINEAVEINNAIDRFSALFEWLDADKFLEGDCYKQIDTLFLGNPLELTPDAVAAIFKKIVSSAVVFEA